MPLMVFPVHLFNPKAVTVRPVRQVISGGTALSGEEDVIQTDGGGRWEILFDDIDLRTPAQIKAWEAWDGILSAGLTDCLVPMLSLSYANRSDHGRWKMAVAKLVADHPVFPTSVTYSAPPIEAHISVGAGVRATAISIIVDKGAPLVGGEKFSLGERGYRVVQPLGSDQFRIWPPLREAIGINTPVRFDWPVVKCRSAPGESFTAALSMGRTGKTSIRFLENAA